MKVYFLAVVIFACVRNASQYTQSGVKESRRDTSNVKKSSSSELHDDCPNCLGRSKRFWNDLWKVPPSNNVIEAIDAAKRKSMPEMDQYCASCPTNCFALPPKQESQTVCEWQTMNMSCKQGETLKIASAMFGRKDRSICQIGPVKTTKCASLASLSATQCRCENKQKCSLKAESTIFGDPCRGTYKYLNVVYQCVTGGKKRSSPPGSKQCMLCVGTQKEVCRIFQGHRLKFWGGLWGRSLADPEDEDEDMLQELLKDEISRD